MNILIAIYSHTEFYPPSINAIKILSKNFDEIDVLVRPFTNHNSITDSNVNIHSVGKLTSPREQESSSKLKKIWYFLHYTFKFIRLITTKKTDWILLYDGIPFLSYYLIKWLIPSKTRLWYHNHDVYQSDLIKKGSLSWYSWKAESKYLNTFDLFTLPAIERKKYFNLNNYNGAYFTIPNYPSLLSFKNISKKKNKLENEIKIIFQGSIGTGHGIEEIISIINSPSLQKRPRLILKGFIQKRYKKYLEELAAKYGVSNRVDFIGQTDYAAVKELTSHCHIGIGIFTKNDLMNRTLGTASNKIYEYAACGLPIIYFDNKHFNNYLGKYNWAFPTDLSQESLVNCINSIIKEHHLLSQDAIDSFETELNFENGFKSTLAFIKKKIENSNTTKSNKTEKTS